MLCGWRRAYRYRTRLVARPDGRPSAPFGARPRATVARDERRGTPELPRVTRREGAAAGRSLAAVRSNRVAPMVYVTVPRLRSGPVSGTPNAPNEAAEDPQRPLSNVRV